MLSPELIALLEKREFISCATCDFKGHPNAAPKFILKVDKHCMYLVDYIIGMTHQNLVINPQISLSFVDSRTITGYQLNGTAKIIDKGKEYEKLRREMLDREIKLTTKHIIADVRGEAKYDNYEVAITEKYVIFKIKIYEIVEIGSKGTLKRKRKESN